MITVLAGQNSFMLQAELRSRVAKFVSEYSDIGLERLDGEEASYDRIRESLESLPFLASKKLVVLRTPGANKQFVENYDKLVDNLPDTTDLIIVEPKLDKRSAYYKYLKKLPNFAEYNELDGAGLASWLSNEAKQRGGGLGMSDANLLVGRIGINQQLLSNELDKLLLYQPKIDRQSILLLTDQTPQSTTFDLLDAALSGQAKRALELYEDQRKQKVDPTQIIALMAWQLHVVAVVKAAAGRDPQAIASDSKINPFVIRKSSSIAARLSLAELKQMIADVRLLDVRLKTESIDADEALSELIISMSR